jgi:tripartite-type tricarboxylate transporter receptor subunit TctC
MKKIFFGLFMTLFAVLAQAQSLAGREVVIITSFPVGSGPDVVLRQLQPELAKVWNTNVIVENRPGGSGTIAFNACKQALSNNKVIPLCYTEAAVLWAHPLVTGNPELTSSLKLLIPSHVADLVLVAPNNVKNLQDLKVLVERRRNFGSWAVGSVGQISSNQVSEYFKVQSDHVPYRDYNQWLIDISNSQLPFSFVTVGSSQAMLKLGKVHYLAIANETRDPLYPDLPTVNEFLGTKNFINLRAIGTFFIDQSIDQNTNRTLYAGLYQVLNRSEVKADLISRLYRPWTASESESQRVFDRDRENYYRLLKKYKIEMRQ